VDFLGGVSLPVLGNDAKTWLAKRATLYLRQGRDLAGRVTRHSGKAQYWAEKGAIAKERSEPWGASTITKNAISGLPPEVNSMVWSRSRGRCPDSEEKSKKNGQRKKKTKRPGGHRPSVLRRGLLQVIYKTIRWRGSGANAKGGKSKKEGIILGSASAKDGGERKAGNEDHPFLKKKKRKNREGRARVRVTEDSLLKTAGEGPIRWGRRPSSPPASRTKV